MFFDMKKQRNHRPGRHPTAMIDSVNVRVRWRVGNTMHEYGDGLCIRLVLKRVATDSDNEIDGGSNDDNASARR